MANNRTEKLYEMKFFLPVLAACAVMLTIFGIVLYNTTKNIVESQLGMNAQGVAVAASLIIMENINDYKIFLETRDTESDYYKMMQRYFADIKSGSNVKFIFTERKLDDETIEFILDSEPIGSENYSPVGSTGPNDWKRETVYSTKRPANFGLYNHPVWGKVIASYAPLFDDDGEFLGILGINFDSSELFNRLNTFFIDMLVTFAILIVIILVLISRMSYLFLEPMLKDKLTGAYNKRYFDKFIKAEMKYAERKGTALSILMLDLDHFKKVNDVHGHLFGDRVLQSVSMTIRDMLRKGDSLVRYGGEEFIVVLPGTELKNAVRIAERIRKAVEKTSVFDSEQDIDIKMTISVGVAQMKNKRQTATELVDSADKALYVAKIDRNKIAAAE